MLEQIIISSTEIEAYRSIASKKLNNPLLKFYECIKDRDYGRANIISMEGSISIDAMELFWAVQGAIKDKLKQSPATAFDSYRKITDSYSLFIAASYAHDKLSKHVEGEIPYVTLLGIQTTSEDYLLMNQLMSNYLTGTSTCKGGKELAQLTKGFFSRIKELMERELSSNIFEDFKKRIEINVGGNYKFSGLEKRFVAEEIKNKPNEVVTLADVGGNHKVKAEVAYLIKALKDPNIKRFGYVPPRSILFYGYPGTGKTLVAKAIACECNLPFHYFDLAETLSKWQGESEKNLKSGLSKDGLHFIDEFDSLGKRYEYDSGNTARLLNVLAEVMDGFNSNPNTIYIAATNEIKLEKKIKNRFQEYFFFDFPDENDIKEILVIHLKKKQKAAQEQIFDGLDVNNIARRLYIKSIEARKVNPELGIVGRDIKSIVEIVHKNKCYEYLSKGAFNKISTQDFCKVIEAYDLKERG